MNLIARRRSAATCGRKALRAKKRLTSYLCMLPTPAHSDDNNARDRQLYLLRCTTNRVDMISTMWRWQYSATHTIMQLIEEQIRRAAPVTALIRNTPKMQPIERAAMRVAIRRI
eukprot:IDg4677t1